MESADKQFVAGSGANDGDTQHVAVSRRGRFTGPLDAALAEHNLQRRVSAVLPSHLAAMTLAARSDIVCLVPAALPGAVSSRLHMPG